MSDERIVPGLSMCGVNLGDSESDILRVLGVPTSSTTNEVGVFLRYDDHDISLLDDSASMLIAKSAACGRTPDGIAVGAPWSQLAEVGDIGYDEDMALWFVVGHPGVWYEVVRPPESYEDPLLDPYVTEVYGIQDSARAHVRRIYVMHGSGEAWVPS